MAMTIPQIKEKLKQKKIDFKGVTRKADLLTLLALTLEQRRNQLDELIKKYSK
jgi:hypothetical protein